MSGNGSPIRIVLAATASAALVGGLFLAPAIEASDPGVVTAKKKTRKAQRR